MKYLEVVKSDKAAQLPMSWFYWQGVFCAPDHSTLGNSEQLY